MAGEVINVISARDNPHHTIYCSNATGRWQLYTWNRHTDEHRRLTHHRHGVNYARISPDGKRVLWFDDPDGGEQGQWMEQTFDSNPGDEHIVAPTLGPHYPQGIAVGNDVIVMGLGNQNSGFAAYKVVDGQETKLYSGVGDQPLTVRTLSADGQLVALQDSSKYKDPECPQVRILRVNNGEIVADLDHGPGKEFVPIEFSPQADQPWLLVQADHNDWRTPLLWNPLTGEEKQLPISVDGEISNRWDICHYRQLAQWGPDGQEIFFALDHGIRTKLFSYRLGEQPTLTEINTEPGTLSELNVGPHGRLDYRWGTVKDPWQYRQPESDHRLFPVTSNPELAGVTVKEIRVPSPGGDIPVTVVFPAGPQPDEGYSTLLGPHGGPHIRFGDEPLAALYEEALKRGCLLVLDNYRGSLGNGSIWRDTINGRAGTIEVDDTAAALKHVLEQGWADPKRVVGAASSYGGYVLLGLFTTPEYSRMCSQGIVVSAPMCDPEGIYRDPSTRADFQASFRVRYGGTPEESPEVWRAGSPLARLANTPEDIEARIVFNERDPRCCPSHIQNFIDRAHDLGKTNIEGIELSGGHNKMYQTVGQAKGVLDYQLDFVCAKLGLEREMNTNSIGIKTRKPVGISTDRDTRAHHIFTRPNRTIRSSSFGPRQRDPFQ